MENSRSVTALRKIRTKNRESMLDSRGRRRDANIRLLTMEARKTIQRTPLWATLLGTFFGTGRMRPGPGTWASVAPVLLWALLAYNLPSSLRTAVAIGMALLVKLIGVPSATLIARGSGIKDPQFVVIDEVAGQLVALIALPLTWKSFLAGFILFRVFDIVKPPPVRQLEAIAEGAGIVLDDVAAGLYALAVMHLFLHFGLLK